jgi:hypothetical protein
MTAANDLTGALRALEESLLQPPVRSSTDQVTSLIADEFIEIGSSGRVYDKAQIVAALAEEPKQGPTAGPIASDFAIVLLAEGVALVTYQTDRRRPDGAATRSRRSSIWKQINGRWQMVFHQGTPVPPDLP